MNRNAQRRKDIRIMTDEEIKKVHEVYLKMAEDIFKVCEKNHIRAMLSGGSVLGAIRHKGFIPWDDDLDLNIPREDFEKLKLIFDDEFQGKYLLHAPNYYRSSGYRIGKIEYPAVDIEDISEKHHGLNIDVFVIENVPDNYLVRLCKGLLSQAFMAIAACVGEYEMPVEKVKGIRRITGRLMSFYNSQTWNDKVDIWNQWNNDSTKMVGIPTGRNHYFGEIYTRKALMETQIADFENIKLPIPKGYAEYLKKLYGDYDVIPAEDKKEHHYIKNISF